MAKQVVCVLFCLVFVTGCFSFGASASVPVSAFFVSREEWNAGWESFGESNTNACLTPGGDETRLNFAWHAPDNAGASRVMLSKSPDMSGSVTFLGTSTPAEAGFKTCRVTVTGLEPGMVYYYTYGAGALKYGPFVYRSAPSGKFKFLFVNDIHQGYDENDPAVGRDRSYDIHSRLAVALERHPDASFILSGGDQVRSGYKPGEWNALLASPVFRSVPVAFAVGNHDKTGETMRTYLNNPNEYDSLLASKTGKDYWFRYGNALFLVFDSTNGNASAHLRFANDAVSKNPDVKWRIGLLHHDLYTPAYPVLLPVVAVFAPIADMAGLDVMLEGHSHVFGRSHHLEGGRIVKKAFEKESADPGGTVYISMNAFLNGSSSEFPWRNPWTAKRCYGPAVVYSTFEADDEKLVFNAFSPEGELMDEYTIVKTAQSAAPFREPASPLFYTAVEALGLIYALIDSFVVRY